MGREHWVETTLGDIADVIGGGTPDSSDESNFNFEQGIPWLTPKDLSGYTHKYISKGVRFLTKKGLSESSAKLLPRGTVLLTSRAPIGYVAIASNEICTNQGFKSFVCSAGVCNEYVYYFLMFFRNDLQEMGSGTTFKEISGSVAKTIPIPLPPLSEQKRIVEKLDAILPKVKNAKARLEKILLILKKFRQSVLSAACSGRLTEDWRAGKEELPVVIAPNVTAEHDLDIPESWVVCRAKDACINVESGSTPKGKPFTATGEIPYLKVYNIVNQNIIFDYKPQFIPKTVHEKELKRCKCYPNDVLMNIVGPPLGKIALVTDQFPEWNINQAIVVYRPQNFLTSLFLYYWLCSLEPIKATMKDTRGSAGQVNISLTQARNIFVPLPPLEEQQEIVRRVEKLFTLADSLEAKYKKAIQRVEKVEQSVLAKAFRGELADPDPNDEPAAELLNRILEEKTKLESTKKPRSRHLAIAMHY